MAKTSVSQWDTVANNNTDVGGISLAENVMQPPAVNDAFREIMAQIKAGTVVSTAATATVGMSFNLYEATNNGSNKITIQTPATLGGDRTVTFPDAGGTLVLDTATQTLTNKRVQPRVVAITSSSTPTPNVDTTDQYNVTALAAAAAFGAPTGTPTDGQILRIRIKDNGTARALTWNAAYREGGDLPLPATTTVSKTMYLAFAYNDADSKYDFIGYLDNF